MIRSNAATVTAPNRWISPARAPARSMRISVSCSPGRKPASIAARASLTDCPICGISRDGSDYRTPRLRSQCDVGGIPGLNAIKSENRLFDLILIQVKAATCDARHGCASDGQMQQRFHEVDTVSVFCVGKPRMRA